MISAQSIKDLRERTGVGFAKCKEALEETNGDLTAAIELLRKKGAAAAVKKASREANEGMIKYLEDENFLYFIELNAETDFVVNNEKFQQFHDRLLQELKVSKSLSVDEFHQHKPGNEKGKTVDDLRRELISVIGENILISKMLIIEKKEQASYGVYAHLNGKIVTFVEISGSKDEGELAREIAMHVAAESPEYLDKEEIPAEIIQKEKEIAQEQVPANKPEQVKEKIIEGKLSNFYNSVCLLRQNFIKDPSVQIHALVEKKSKEIGKTLAITKFVRLQVGM